jgi:hypothetical protein
MFVYQNKDKQICVTFADNKPVENPEYVIAIDAENKALYMVSGEIAPMPEDDVVEVTESVDEDAGEELNTELPVDETDEEEPTVEGEE